MAYTVTNATPMTTITENSVYAYKVQGKLGGTLVIRGTYTKGDETATAFKVSTRTATGGTDYPVYKIQVGTDNTMVQYGPSYSATGRFEVVVPLFSDDKYIVITITATGSATGTIAFAYADVQAKE